MWQSENESNITSALKRAFGTGREPVGAPLARRYMYSLRISISIFFFLFCAVVRANEYIEPEKIRWLSKEVRADLIAKGCKIPKVIHWEYSDIKMPSTGILTGQFAAQGQHDIAIICENEKKESHILFYWGGTETCQSQLRSWGESIKITNEESIIEHALAYGGPKPKEITHDPIEDILFSKSSIVYYCNNGKWENYAGAD